MGMCIMGLPIGCVVEVIMPDKEIFNGRIIHNYGSSLVLDCGEDGSIILSAMEATVIRIKGKDNTSLFHANLSKEAAAIVRVGDKELL